MSAVAKQYKCAVCGDEVDPAVDILYRAGSTSLFPVHRDECASVVRDGVVTARKLIERRFPIIKAARKFLNAIMK